MTWKDKIVFRILLLIASTLSESEVVKKEITHISNTIFNYREGEK